MQEERGNRGRARGKRKARTHEERDDRKPARKGKSNETQ